MPRLTPAAAGKEHCQTPHRTIHVINCAAAAKSLYTPHSAQDPRPGVEDRGCAVHDAQLRQLCRQDADALHGKIAKECVTLPQHLTLMSTYVFSSGMAMMLCTDLRQHVYMRCAITDREGGQKHH